MADHAEVRGVSTACACIVNVLQCLYVFRGIKIAAVNLLRDTTRSNSADAFIVHFAGEGGEGWHDALPV